jgi:hypothetical protein
MPAGGDQDYLYVELNDFSPGIYDDWYSLGGAQTAPPGAAQLTGTFGCLSGRGGGLIPAPKRVNRVQETLFGVGGNYPVGDVNTHITAFRVLSPVYDRTGVAAAARGTVRPFPDQLFVAFEYYQSGAHNSVIRTYKMHQQSAANPAIGTVGTFNISTAATAAAAAPFYYGFSAVEFSRSNSVDPTAAGYPIAATGFTSCKDQVTQTHKSYPAVASPTVDSVDDIAGLAVQGGFSAYGLLAHQDRIIGLTLTVNFGIGTGGELPFDGLTGTNPNDISTNGFLVTTFCSENPGLFGSFVSMNSSEIFVVKQQRGGYAIRGDVANPTVIRLPGVEPTFDAANIGTIDNNGVYVYGTKRGVFGWSGGDTSPYLSPQLDGWFWQTGGAAGTDNYLFIKGQFSRVGSLIFAPNNFILDTVTKSWWKLTDTTTQPVYTFWDTTAGGNAVGVVASVSGTQQVLADWYDPTQGQSSYSWRSQPLAVTKNRVVVFREFTLMAQGVGTVTVTTTGINGATDVQSFTINSANQPVTIEKEGMVKTHDAYVTIASDSGNQNVAAPRVYRLRLGYHEEETAR